MQIAQILAIPPWAEIPNWPIRDWQLAVKEGDTLLGYRDWVIVMNQLPLEINVPPSSNLKEILHDLSS